MSEWKFYIDHKDWGDVRDLYIIKIHQGDGGPQRYIAKPLELQLVPAGQIVDEPTMREFGSEGSGDVTGYLQAAMDAAWEAGLRPKGLEDQRNELKAVRYHLEDMRTLAKVNRP